MADDRSIDQWLQEAMAADVPQPSAGFDARVMAGVRGRRLPAAARAGIGAYAVGALALTVWTMGDLDVALIGLGTIVSGLVAAGVSHYVRGVTMPSRG